MKKILLLFFLCLSSLKICANDLGIVSACINAASKLFVNQQINFWVQIGANYSDPVAAGDWRVLVNVYNPVTKKYVLEGEIPGVNISGGTVTLTSSLKYTPTAAGILMFYFYIYYRSDMNSQNNYVSYEIYVNGPPSKVNNPHPNNETVDVGLGVPVTLTWQNQSGQIDGSRVNLGETPEEITSGLGSVYTLAVGNGESYPVHGLEGNKSYYWRLDQWNPAGTTLNDIWNFTTHSTGPQAQDYKATPTSPPTGSTVNVNPNPVLGWLNPLITSGLQRKRIYYGPTAESANPASGLPVMTITGNEDHWTVSENLIVPNSTQYWAIETVYENGMKYLSDVFSHYFNNIYDDDLRNNNLSEGATIPSGPTPVIPFTGFENPISNTHRQADSKIEAFIASSSQALLNSTTPVASTPIQVGVNNIAIPQLEFNATYYSRLAINSGGNRRFGETRMFKTQAPSSVTGTVEIRPDPTKPATTPATNATVTVTANVSYNNLSFGQYTRTTTVGSSGTYILMDLIAGNYLITTALQGYRVYSPGNGKYEGTFVPGQTKFGHDFTFVPLSSSLHGIKWSDNNGNGVKDADEPIVQDWTIYLNGTTTSGQTIQQISTKTDASGIYRFDNLQPGTYQITEEAKTGWTLSYPTGGSHSVTVEAGIDAGDKNFGNIPPKTIEGIKWRDNNGDGKKDENEPVIQDWKILLSGTTNSGQTVQLNTKTDANGIYRFENLLAGTYQITEELKTSWKQSYPASGSHTINLTTSIDNSQKNFGNVPPGIIEGIKFYDENGNGKKDATEIGMNGVKIEIYKNNNLVKTIISGSKDKNADSFIDPKTECGIFSFEDLEIGQYIIKEILPTGLIKTYPKGDSFTIDLKPGQKIDTLVFGNKATSIDFGDAPDPFVSSGCFIAQCYPTKLPLGARHVPQGVKLGKQRDAEADGLPTTLCDGDDKNGIDDEDGISITKYSIGGSGEVKVEILGEGKDFPCYLYAWIDFNKDGYFGFNSKDPQENILKQKIEQTGISTFTFNIPSGTVRNVNARFRISSNEESILLPYGISYDGEVEDYNVDNHIVGIKELFQSEIPSQYVLRQNYPNPFNPNTTITFEIPKESHVVVKVFDALGNLISVLVNEKKSAGVYQTIFDGSTLPSGIYFYQMQAGDFTQTKKLMLVK